MIALKDRKRPNIKSLKASGLPKLAIKRSRRDFLKGLTPEFAKAPNYQFDGPSEKGIDPYTGPWTFQEAAHLLRRATFGPSYQMMKDAVTNGMDNTVAQLLTDLPIPSEPVNSYYANDPNVPIGESWIGKPFFGNDLDAQQTYEYRHLSIRSRQMEAMLTEGVSVTEKMTLFWHNHFVTGDIDEPHALYYYGNLIRQHALGNFKQLTKEMTIDAAMLIYLNGNENINSAPNENFARELLELFTIGKGPLAGPGDYTYYTEHDIQEAAKILTGWQVVNGWTYDINKVLGTTFFPSLHDDSTKQLSHRFNNATIANNGADEYKDLVDIIFLQDEVSKFLVRKIYRWFVYYDINATVEMKVIEPLASVFRDNDYDIKPVLETLFKSEHFFDTLSMGCMIKNPIDYNLSLLKQFPVPIPTELADRHLWLFYVFYFSANFGMEYFLPPSVAGWKAYYQSPNYYRIWMNSVTFQERRNISVALLEGLEDFDSGLTFAVDKMAFLQSTDNPYSADAVVEEFAKITCPMPLADNQKVFCKAFLLSGLDDAGWSSEYDNYVSDPTNEPLRIAIENRVRNLLVVLSILPEYHLH